LKEKIKDFFRNIKLGIPNLIKWFPIIWKDRDWDHQYIYEVFRHKLHLTEQFIRSHGVHTNNIADADKIKVCVNLLDRLIKDEYHESAFKHHEEKWGIADFNWHDSEEHKGMSELSITHPNVETDEDKKVERKDFKNACKHEAALREQDLDLLFKNMRKHIQSWWD
jgi:hypothetical protein